MPHVESFNYCVDEGIHTAVNDIPAREFTLGPGGRRVRLWVEDAQIGFPAKSDGSADGRLLPAECRERGITYGGTMTVKLRCQFGDEAAEVQCLDWDAGAVPIMVMSKRCHLRGQTPAQLTRMGEESSEAGGYFICNGIERVVRMLQMPRRNFPMAVVRNAFKKRGPTYTDKGLQIRCARKDQTTVTNFLHYQSTGAATLRFSISRQEFFINAVLLMRALRDTTDREVFDAVLGGDVKNATLAARIQLLIQEATQVTGKVDRDGCLAFIGERFRITMDVPESLTDVQVGRTVLDRFVLVHLTADSPSDAADGAKFDLLALMLRKLYTFVDGRISEDNADSLANQELLLAGHFYNMFLKEQVADSLKAIEETMKVLVRIGKVKAGDVDMDQLKAGLSAGRRRMLEQAKPLNGNVGVAYTPEFFRRTVERCPDIGKAAYYLMATGTLRSSTGLDLLQASGYTVVADKINFLRFATHFRAVHRGQFFAEMKTTAVRKLLPDSWGFLCPVHTPDGSPCGLLNHLAAPCQAVTHPPANTSHLIDLLVGMGVTPLYSLGGVVPHTLLPVLVDGRVIGAADLETAVEVSRQLRRLKVTSGNGALTPELALSEDAADAEGAPGDGASSATHRSAASRNRRKLRDRVYRLLTEAGGARLEAAGAAAGAGGAAAAAAAAALPGAVPISLEVAVIPPTLVPTDPRAAASAGGGGDDDDDDDSMGGAEESKRSTASAGDSGIAAPFAGVFIMTEPARLVRPTLQLDVESIGAGFGVHSRAPAGGAGFGLELVGPMEQQFLDIACSRNDFGEIAGVRDGEAPGRLPYSHLELSPMAMLSFAASLTPFSDLNQSPRNMYQCQMAKQTMGTPCHAYNHRSDTKLYRIQNPQAAIVQNTAQSEMGFDQYAAGCNAVVAVIAYTGMDMEDAMIINKSAYERGFGHGSVYKTITVDLAEQNRGENAGRYSLANPRSGGRGGRQSRQQRGSSQRQVPSLDADGLPVVGTLLSDGDALYSVFDSTLGDVKVTRHKGAEAAYVEAVRLLGPQSTKAEGKAGEQLVRASIRLRFNRNPVVGDKFSSRHGQKGVMSILWPQRDMPFSESGLSPDIIINPHAFPSRMTIGMLVESMAGKSGAMFGEFQDSTPFRFDERNKAVDHFGSQLRQAGYAYYGSEALMSGTTGEPLHCDIYMGLVYYQRLRHMVSDKSQVRASSGPINPLTRQPVKGRKRHGGIRFGEMERDSLISHGSSFLLHDRLMNSSDRHIGMACRKCGSLLSVSAIKPDFGCAEAMPTQAGPSSRWTCRTCRSAAECVPVAMPYVFRYLTSELAGMNIKMTLDLDG